MLLEDERMRDHLEERPSIPTLGFAAYRQVAAVLSAFGVAAILQRLFNLDWRSYLGTLVGYWDQYIHPLTAWIIESPIGTPARWAFGWQTGIPGWAKDYVGLGLVFCLTFARYMRSDRDLGAQFHDLWEMRFPSAVHRIIAFTVMGSLFFAILAIALILGVVLWPALMLVDVVQHTRILIRAMRAERGSRWWQRLREEVQADLVIYAPFLYLALLAAINFWVLS